MNSRKWSAVLALAGAFSLALVARARQTDQQAQPQLHHLPAGTETAKPGPAKPVIVYAIVRDKHGKIVPNLTRSDFSLEEDGRPQTISQFTAQTSVPLTIGLLVDTGPGQRAVIVPERKASYTFLDRLLTENDRAFLIHFDREVELLQDLTNSRPKLQSALQLLDTPDPDFSNRRGGSGNPGGGRGPAGQAGARGNSHLYDAIWLAANDLMKKQTGRKALFVLSDGVDRGSKKSLTDAIEAAQRADTAVYTIDSTGQEIEDRGPRRRGGWGGVGFPGGGWPGGGGGQWPRGGGGGNRYPSGPRVDGKRILLQISQRTGGVMFEVSKNLSLDRIFSVAEEGFRNQYQLAYTPNPPDDSGYHVIHVAVKKKGATAQIRQGYYSQP